MQFSSQLLENAVNEFAKLPGIGKKTALRLVLHLLKQEENNVQQFSEVIAKMRNEIKFCQRFELHHPKQLVQFLTRSLYRFTSPKKEPFSM